MSSKKAERWTEEYARKVLARADRRGLSDSALAREMGIHPARLWWWRRRLRNEPQMAVEAQFIEVKVTAPAQPFAIHTRSGRTIAVWPGFDTSELGRLLRVVEESC